jgi:hypothetical protein
VKNGRCVLGETSRHEDQRIGANYTVLPFRANEVLAVHLVSQHGDDVHHDATVQRAHLVPALKLAGAGDLVVRWGCGPEIHGVAC